MAHELESSVRLFGVYQGRVRELAADDKMMDRALLEVPAILGSQFTHWARPISPMLACSWKPQVGDLVWVMFENGDPDRPLYMGSWWDQDPERKETTLPDEAKDNYPNSRVIKAPDGSKIVFNEDSVLIESSGGTKLRLAGGEVLLEEPSGVKLKLSGGKVALGGSSEELLALLSEFITSLVNDTIVPTFIGPQKLINPNLLLIKDRLDTIKGTI